MIPIILHKKNALSQHRLHNTQNNVTLSNFIQITDYILVSLAISKRAMNYI
jgi:hypothetical protein